MNQKIKIILLKRKFLSIEYAEEFISNYQQFIQTGLDALEIYLKYRKSHPEFIPTEEIIFEESFWLDRVRPNFQRMLHSSKNTLIRIKNNEPNYSDYLDGLAGNFRGLSRGFDGVSETFMDVATPEARKKYRHLWDITDIQACNIEKAINNWWKDSSILDEEITGVIMNC